MWDCVEEPDELPTGTISLADLFSASEKNDKNAASEARAALGRGPPQGTLACMNMDTREFIPLEFDQDGQLKEAAALMVTPFVAPLCAHARTHTHARHTLAQVTSLLCTKTGNGLGGGDFPKEWPQIGRWAGDHISVLQQHSPQLEGFSDISAECVIR